MKRTVLLVQDLYYPLHKDYSCVNMTVVFKELQHLGPIPFTASISDAEDHSRELYCRAISGEFGPIKPAPDPVKPVKPPTLFGRLRDRLGLFS